MPTEVQGPVTSWEKSYCPMITSLIVFILFDHSDDQVHASVSQMLFILPDDLELVLGF